MSSTTLENCRQYAAQSGEELSMTFNFHHLKVDYAGGEKMDAGGAGLCGLKQIFRHWQQGMYNRAWNALFWWQPRSGPHRIAASAMKAHCDASRQNAGDGAARHAGRTYIIRVKRSA